MTNIQKRAAEDFDTIRKHMNPDVFLHSVGKSAGIFSVKNLSVQDIRRLKDLQYAIIRWFVSNSPSVRQQDPEPIRIAIFKNLDHNTLSRCPYGVLLPFHQAFFGLGRNSPLRVCSLPGNGYIVWEHRKETTR